MKKYIILAISFFAFLFATTSVSASYPDKDVASLFLKVKNIMYDQGKIYIAIFNTGKTFMKDRYIEEAILVNSFDDLKVELKLPYGKYAVSIFHDVNDNEKLNTNIIGIPKEPYGFSNNPKTTFGPPDFEQTSFELYGDSHEIEIFLR